MTRKLRRRIAPRLANGDRRVLNSMRLPPAVKQGLVQIARTEGKSVSWVLEETVYTFFGIKRPRMRIPASWSESKSR